MNQKNMLKAVVAVAVALAFILPGVAAFANVGTVDIRSDSDNIPFADKTVDILMLLQVKTIIYVDDDAPNDPGPGDQRRRRLFTPGGKRDRGYSSRLRRGAIPRQARLRTRSR